MDITPHYVSRYPKVGLSAWIGAARLVGDTAQEWERRRQVPIVYLLKVAGDAIHERLYYVLARVLGLPQQHVYWAVAPPHEDLVAVTIRFEYEAFFLRSIEVPAQTVTFRRKTHHVPNTADFWRHEVLHRYCGTDDIHQAMVKGNVLFGIDAADCIFHAPFIGYVQNPVETAKNGVPPLLPSRLKRESLTAWQGADYVVEMASASRGNFTPWTLAKAARVCYTKGEWYGNEAQEEDPLLSQEKREQAKR